MSDYFGTCKGLVVNNNDPLGLGRVICMIPKVLGDAASGWIDPYVPGVVKPQVNDILYINFIDGDPARGIYHGTQSVSAGQIIAGALDAQTINGNTITGATITGGTITGSVFQTAASGMAMFMQNQVGDTFSGLSFTTGLSPTVYPAGPELFPGQIGLTWDTPVSGPPDGTTNTVSLQLSPPSFGAWSGSNAPPFIYIQGRTNTGFMAPGGGFSREIGLVADLINLANDGGLTTMSVSTAPGVGVRIGQYSQSNARAINGIDWTGSTAGNGSTNSSGQNTYNHNLGTTPGLVLIMSRNTYLIPMWVSATSTTFTVEWFTPSTNAVAVGYNPTIGYLALA